MQRKLDAPRPRVLAGLLLASWAVFLALPSSNITRFDGVPFSSYAEAGALALTIPLLLFASLRRLFTRWLATRGPRIGAVTVVAVLAGIVCKGLLLTSRPFGFPACYQSTLTPPPAGTCERSFENPFFLSSATRIDRSIDFGPEDWNLSFFNSDRFNFYPWVAGNRRRDRLPFTVTWHGLVDAPARQTLAVTYVGQGSVALDETVVVLPAAYDGERTIHLDVPPGRHSIRSNYTFDDGSRTGTAPPRAPYATFRIESAAASAQPARALRPASPPGWTRVAAFAADAIGIGVTVALLLWYVGTLRREAAMLAVIAAAEAAVVPAAAGVGAVIDVRATVVVWLLLVFVLARNRSARLLVAYFALLAVTGLVTFPTFPHLGTVVYRGAGQDYLTYESFARDVLEQWSFAGGEKVFYVQPLFRYVRFAERFLLGDGDPLLIILGRTALYWSILWGAASVRGRRAIGGARRILFVAAAALTLALAGSARVVEEIALPLSESITWIFLALGFALLSGYRPSRRWPAGAASFAAALITRPNQAPGLFAAAVALIGPAARAHWRSVVTAAAVFCLVCLLPLVHNLYYGGRAVIFTTTATNPAALGVPLPALARIFSDAAVRTAVADQVRGLLFLPPFPSKTDARGLAAVMHGLQAVWLIALWLAWRRDVPGNIRWLALVPAFFLAVHVVYDIRVYYPRHILAAYFAMGLVATVVSMTRPANATQIVSTVAARPSTSAPA